MPRVSGVSGSRQTRIAVPARNGASPCGPAKVSTPSIALAVRLQPRTGEAHAPQQAGGVGAELPQAQDAHGRLARLRRQGEGPAGLALLPGEDVELAMVLEHQGEHELAHHAGERGVDQPAQRQVRQGLVGQHGIDTGAQGQDQPQVRQRGQQSRRRPPDQRRVDLGQVARIRPDPNVEVGRVAQQGLAPGLRVLVRTVEQQRHAAEPRGRNRRRLVARLSRAGKRARNAGWKFSAAMPPSPAAPGTSRPGSAPG